MRGVVNYWRLGLLLVVWVSGWAFACLSFVQAIKAYDVEINIQIFLRSMLIQMFLPTLLFAAVCLAGSLLFWHPAWADKIAPIKKRTKHLATNIIQ